jgi:DNA-binding NtrC family response regulator
MAAQEVPISSTGAGAEELEEPAILLLQADDDVRSLVSDSLEHDGYMVLGARDYSEAVEWMTIHPGPIALLVTGMDLSHTSAPPELIAQISARHTGIRVIFTGDHAMVPAVRNVWMEHGARFLKKPFQLEELLAVIRAMLAESYPGGPQTQPAVGPLDTTREPVHSEAA